LFNTYRGFSPLILEGTEKILFSQEGVTQGDPLSMLLYGVATLPLIDALKSHKEVIQNWYADDASAIGDLESVRQWLFELIHRGPNFGYFPEPQKSYLVVPERLKDRAESLFVPLGVKVVTGQRFLGGYIGDKEGRQIFVSKKIVEWCNYVEQLANVAKTQPQCAFASLTKSLQFEWAYIQNVVVDCQDLFSPLESMITEKFLPALFQSPISSLERTLFSLPARHGGLGIRKPTETSAVFYSKSRTSTKIIQDSITQKTEFSSLQHHHQLQSTRFHYRQTQEKLDQETFNRIIVEFSPTQQRALKAQSAEKSSGWLTVLPVAQHHFDLSAQEFRDALSLRYRRPLLSVPSNCDGCGAPFTLSHALDCKRGGLIIVRHNEIRDAFGDLANIAWPNVIREPVVRDSNDSEGISALVADLGVRGVWQPQSVALFDIRVIDTDAQSYATRTIPSLLQSAESQKKSKYHDACEMGHASFTPLVVTADGLFGREAKSFIHHLCERIALKWGKNHSEVCHWVRVRLSFSILRATEFCIRGSRRKWRSLGIGEDGASIPTRY
jgi:hypothetical protein